MYKSGKVFLSSFNHFLRAFVVAIFLIGMLPIPALAADNGMLAGQVTDNTSAPISGATILVYSANATMPGWSALTALYRSSLLIGTSIPSMSRMPSIENLWTTSSGIIPKNPTAVLENCHLYAII